jgi:hypothetical protein
VLWLPERQLSFLWEIPGFLACWVESFNLFLGLTQTCCISLFLVLIDFVLSFLIAKSIVLFKIGFFFRSSRLSDLLEVFTGNIIDHRSVVSLSSIPYSILEDYKV